MDETRKAELILLGLSAIWGTTFPVIKLGIKDYPPLTFVTFRFLIGSILLALLLRKSINRRQIVPGLLIGLSIFAGFGFQVVGLKYTTASNSAFITSLYMVFTPFVAMFLLKSKIAKIDVMALILALFGTYLISGATLKLNYGDMLTTLAAFSFAFQIVLIEYFKDLGLGLAFWQIFWNFIFSLVYSLLFEGLPLPRESSTIFAILYTAVVATAFAFLLQVKYQPKIESHRAAILYSAEPVFGHLFSFMILGEVLKFSGYVGALLILSAIWLEIWREKLIKG
ncbi:hypothetical protein PNA2_1209 [Pyrococcus sp. NA2]|uniref:DMT family transporter n=1 Tax=Pyrococcus sp. (strain NA2) TaxID=342949 RepID=UPI000209AC47|nr:DMT family transporter [Pyrococcus sp. NA2]AEC52124.1 hypothetical protein PNA2_1209 [Pyrococcus sp. NA2]